MFEIAIRRYSSLSRPSLDGLRMQAAQNDGSGRTIDERLNGKVCLHVSVNDVRLIAVVLQWFGSGEPETFLSPSTSNVGSLFNWIFPRSASAFVTV
jgi:hypothetical protein